MKALQQAKEVFFQFPIAGQGGGVARNEYDIVTMLHGLAMRAEYLAHAPAEQIARYRVSQPPGGDNPEAGFPGTRTLTCEGKGAEYKKTPCC